MTNLIPFEEKVLSVLKKLQYLCDITALYKHNTKTGIEYSFGDFFPPVKGQEELEYIVQYLYKHGLDISITFDIYNNDPRELVQSHQYQDEGSVPLGLIKGKNIEDIKININSIISKLKNKEITIENYHQKSEDIKLKPLGILIKNNQIIYRRNKSEQLNYADQEIISFLYHAFIKNTEWAYSKEHLTTQLGFNENYIVNRISKINQEIRSLITSGKTSIGDFIVNERTRGYHLSKRFVIQFTKKKI